MTKTPTKKSTTKKPAARTPASTTPTKRIGLPTRLGVGKGYRGMDWPNCCNTGMATVILKSRNLDVACGFGLTKLQFVVGTENNVDAFQRHLHQYSELKRVWHNLRFASKPTKHNAVYLYTSYASAKKKYNELNDVIKQRHIDAQAERAALAATAAEGHPNDIMALVFHDIDN